MKQFLKKCIIKLKHLNKNVAFSYGAVIGIGSEFEGCNRVGRYSVFSGKMGFGSYIGIHSEISGKIGRFSCISHGVQVAYGTHPVNSVSIHPAFFSAGKQCGITFADKQLFCERKDAEPGYPVVIGNDVWIGQNALLLSGVHIGNGAVIAAGAVVTKDVPPYTVFGGVPAKLIRPRFSSETAALLEAAAWWDWPLEKLKQSVNDFSDVSLFLRKYSDPEPEKKNENM